MSDMTNVFRKMQSTFRDGFSWTKEHGFSGLDDKAYLERSRNDTWYESIARNAGEAFYLYFDPLVKAYRSAIKVKPKNV